MIDRTVFKASVQTGENRAKVIEEMIGLHLQPKPRWMPVFVWQWVIRHLLILEMETK